MKREVYRDDLATRKATTHRAGWVAVVLFSRQGWAQGQILKMRTPCEARDGHVLLRVGYRG